MEDFTSIAVVGAIIINFYLLGRLSALIQITKRQSDITAIASLHALISSEGLKRSTIIQRIIEKYNVVDSELSKKANDLDKELQDAILGTTEKIAAENLKIKQELWGATNLKAEDLV